MEKEYPVLRTELKNLKSCQTQFLTCAVTATTVILSAIGAFQNPTLSILFIAPLAILLPACSVFFDKARTLSRIVGYQQIIERIQLNKCEANNFLGWENSLCEFRKKIDGKEKEKGKKFLLKGGKFLKFSYKLLVFPFQQYWTIVFSIFFYLSVACIIITIVTTNSALPNFISIFTGNISVANIKELTILIAMIITGYTLFVNAVLVFDLAEGKYSYNANASLWGNILKIQNKKPREKPNEHLYIS